MKTLILTLLTLLTTATLMAQAPQRISYQSIIRDANKVVVASSPVGIKISLLQGTATGPAVYVETHASTTNANGLVSLEIGTGTVLSGTFAGIDWSNGPYLIQTETDPTGGTNYSILGIAALNSVPYALNAANATKLRSPVTINGIAFDGSSNVTIPATGAVPYTGATKAVDLGGYDLKVNGVTVGRGKGNEESNTATGNEALARNTIGSGNTASGEAALRSNTTGSYNTASGASALKANTTGSYNTASGEGALSANTSGSLNMASGNIALLNNTTGGFNTASGNATLFYNITGYYNSAFGLGALYQNTTGNFNTAIGSEADVESGALTNATAIGAGAIVNASNTIQLGNTDVTNVITSGTLTAGAVTYPSAHGGANQVLTTTGTGTLTWATPSGGVPYTGATQGVDLGAYDLKVNGLTVGRGSGDIDSNTASGNGALFNNTSGSNNTASGKSALFKNTTGNNNTASGNAALRNNTTGAYNTASGVNALASNTTGVFNMASGLGALYSNTTGANNTASGVNALASNTAGAYNMASGLGALYSNTTGINNTASGYNALFSNTTGSNNTAIGNQADAGSGALTNATAIGSGARVNASNTIQLGNTDVTKVITSGTLTAGTVTYPRAHGSNGQVLTTTGSGTLTWASSSAPTYSVGLNPSLGGYVFYVTPDGKHGLVAETIDQLGAVDFLPENINPNISPAETADDNISNPARHSAAGANFIDWRLPNKYEMLLMYNSRQNIGNFDPTRIYLTSTLSFFYVGWAINFALLGLPVDYNLYFKYNNSALVYKDSIRAVRSF